MNKTSGTSKNAADKLVKSNRRKTRQTYSAEEKIRIGPVLTSQCLARQAWHSSFCATMSVLASMRSPICFRNEPLRVIKDRPKDFRFLRMEASGGSDQHFCSVIVMLVR